MAPSTDELRRRLQRRLDDLAVLYEETVLRLDESRAGRFALDISRAVRAVIHHLRSEPVLERAAALSFGTMLSLVPLLGTMLAIASLFGHEALRNRVREFAFSFMAPSVRRAVSEPLELFIDRATSGGLISGLALLFSAAMLLRSVEGTINRIWGVEEQRPLRVRVAVYLGILIFGPVFLGLSLTATAALRRTLLGEGVPFVRPVLALSPSVLTILGLTALYAVAPNAEVKRRAAVAGGLVAGLVLEVAKHAFTIYTGHFVRYSVIYGSLAAIPLFLVWVYVSWIVLLFGARLAYAVQNAGSWGVAALPRSEGLRARLAARTMLAAAVAHVGKRPAPSILSIARASGSSEAAIAESVRLLRQSGLLDEDRQGGLVPARPLESITLAEVARAARVGEEPEAPIFGADPASRAISEVFSRAEQAGDTSLAQLDLRTLAEPLVGPGATPVPEGQA